LSPGSSRSPEEEAALILASSHKSTPAALNEDLILLPKSANASLDPFDSYPPTRLPRTHAQRLIYHCTKKIIHPG
jgi:hypothetical protein